MDEHGFLPDPHALVWSREGQVLRVEPWGPSSLRIRAGMDRRIHDDTPGALLPREPMAATVERDGPWAVLRHGAITAAVDGRSGRLVLRDAAGRDLLAEPEQAPVHLPGRWFRDGGAGRWSAVHTLNCRDPERIFGLGQQVHGRFDQKGCTIDQGQRNGSVCIPFLVSDQGYALLWNHPGTGRIELGRDRTRLVADRCRQLDWWITAGDPATCLGAYAGVTGMPSPFPAWAEGVWQCKLRYRNPEELRAVARGYRERSLPLSVLVIDYFHWSAMGEWAFKADEWPDVDGLVAELRAQGIEPMVSVWPAVNPAAPSYPELEREGWLVRTAAGLPAAMRFWDRLRDGSELLAWYDATHPGAREHLARRLHAGYGRHGITSYWLDADEPEILPYHPEHLRFRAGDGAEVFNRYPLDHVAGVHAAQRAAGIAAPLNLSRSAWAGAQAHGCAVWNGDVASTWPAFRASVRAGLNMAMSGIPWWTTDAGGFHGGDIRDPGFHELLVRWTGWAAFCPIMRLHGFRLPYEDMGAVMTGAGNEPWSCGPEVESVITGFIRLRERLRPYVRAAMARAERDGIPPLRPLFVDFPADPAVWDVDDQHLLGDDLVVAPVLEPGVTVRRLYAPAGAEWEDPWTGAVHSGGAWIELPAPRDRVPVLARRGSPVAALIRG